MEASHWSVRARRLWVTFHFPLNRKYRFKACELIISEKCTLLMLEVGLKKLQLFFIKRSEISSSFIKIILVCVNTELICSMTISMMFFVFFFSNQKEDDEEKRHCYDQR